jgi:hypothetical protein
LGLFVYKTPTTALFFPRRATGFIAYAGDGVVINKNATTTFKYRASCRGFASFGYKGGRHGVSL